MLFPSRDKGCLPQDSSTCHTPIDPQRLRGASHKGASLPCGVRRGWVQAWPCWSPQQTDREPSLLPRELYFCVLFTGQLKNVQQNDTPLGEKKGCQSKPEPHGSRLWSLLLCQPNPKVKQKETLHLRDSLVYYKQADSYGRASTENQTADEGLEAARYRRAGTQGQPHLAGYREL